MSERKQVLELFEEYKDFTADRVKNGIELYRKGYAFLTVKDEQGAPVEGARITVKQKSHEFRFGANLFMLDELETPEKNEAYKKHFAELFNNTSAYKPRMICRATSNYYDLLYIFYKKLVSERHLRKLDAIPCYK